MNRVADLQHLAADWPAISHRLDEVLAVAPAERDTWLDALCEADSIKGHLRRLLADAAAVETGDFLGTLPKLSLGPTAEAIGDAEGVGVGAAIGPYRLLARLGQGGMGTVWLAERIDGLPRRKVALKLPHVGWAPGLAARLARERDILASLEHPNIARLYDAGMDAAGRPYLALEYVDGTPIDRYCAANALPLRERLALLLQVAAAVAHAHTRLVVHRDLKPSNILVGADGGVRLLDFGIAKLLDNGGDSTELTQVAGGALTPDYASPEQIRGEPIGTASDVYSLGIVAFELLAGVRPYSLKGSAAAGLAEAIAQVEVPLASRAAGTAGKRLRGDLDAILNKALKRDAAERYATVAALAADLERHFRGETVEARPDSLWYRVDRWVRRHKLEAAVGAAIVVAVPAGAAAQAAVLAAIAGGAGVALWQARVARRQAGVAREEAARAEAVKGFLTSFFKAGSLEEDGGAQLGRLTVQQFVERGATKIDAGFSGHPGLKQELLDVVSTLFADLADGARTVEYARQWLRALEQSGAGEVERARATQRLAQGMALLGRSAEAAEAVERAVVRLRGRKSGDGTALLAHLLVDLSRLRDRLGDTPGAIAAVDEALVLVDADAGGDAAAAVSAAAVFQRASLMASANRLDDAVPLFEDALARFVRTHGERSATVGRHRFLFATALDEGRRTGDAEREYRRARELFRDTGGDADLNAAIVELELGRNLAIAGRSRGEGLALLAHAGEVFSARGDSVSPHYGAAANLYLAEALVEDGELERAHAPMAAAVALYRDKVEDVLLRTLAQVIEARYLSECGDYEGSNRVLEATRLDYLRLVGADHPHTASVVNRIGANHLRMERYGLARAAFESILGSEDQVEDVWGSMKHLAQRNLAIAQLETGDARSALPTLQRQLASYHAAAASARNAMSEAGLNLYLGRAYLQAGQPLEALPPLRQSVEILVPTYPKSPGLASNRCWLGLCLLTLGDDVEARALASAARATFAAQPSTGIHHRRALALLEDQLAGRQGATT